MELVITEYETGTTLATRETRKIRWTEVFIQNYQRQDTSRRKEEQSTSAFAVCFPLNLTISFPVGKRGKKTIDQFCHHHHLHLHHTTNRHSESLTYFLRFQCSFSTFKFFFLFSLAWLGLAIAMMRRMEE